MPALLLTWVEAKWPHENIAEMVRKFEAQGFVEEPWNIAAYKQARVGHDVWLLKQGKGSKVIFGHGRLTTSATREAEDGPWRATIRFERFVDPREGSLIAEPDVRRVLDENQIRAQASGVTLTNEQAAELSRLLGQPLLNQTRLRALIRALRHRYPDFKAFESNSSQFDVDERQYKEVLGDRLRTDVLPLIDTPDEFGTAFFRVLSTKGGASQVQNLIRWNIVQGISGSPAAVKAVASALAPLLAAETPSARRNALADMIERATLVLREADVSGPEDALRQLGELVMMLLYPHDHMYCRRTVLDSQYAALMGRAFPRDASHAEQQRVTDEFGQSILTALADEGLRPRDLIDVQSFLWVTRDAITETFQPGAPMVHSLNKILYGPPGCGKTYRTAELAVRICDGDADPDRDALMKRYAELVAAKRIAFVTFHQSFAYEDFIEGLRPESGERTDAQAGPGFRLEVRDGVLKEMANLASTKRGQGTSAGIDVEGRQVYKMSLGRANDPEDAYIYADCLVRNYIALGYGGEIDWSDRKYEEPNAIKKRWQQDHPEATAHDVNIKTVWALRNGMRKHDLVIIPDGNRKFRAIGEVTGDYYYDAVAKDDYPHRRPVRWLWHGENSLPADSVYRVGFVQLTVYRLQDSELVWPTLRELIGSSQGALSPQPHVLIIDEINRANVSKTFGELITLIEEDKRLGRANALTARLPYSGEDFGIPANLYLLGTMNTADRSIALLDAALRRRFEFVEVAPDPEVLSDEVDGIDVQRVLMGLNERLEFLFDRDHLIGHAYFISAKSLRDLSTIMETKIIPLLVEYFHEDWEKVRAVLNDGGDSGAFVSRKRLSAPRTLEDSVLDAETRWRYSIVPGPYPAESFQQLYP